MKVISTPSLKYIVIFYLEGEVQEDFHTDKKGVVYHKLTPTHLKPSEKRLYSSAIIYSR